MTVLKGIFSLSLVVALGAISVLTVGCGGGSNVPPPQSVTPPAAPPAAKQMLLNVAESGELGSGEMSIREDLTKLKATDAAKADSLLQDLDQLKAATDPEQIKSMAKAMADKL